MRDTPSCQNLPVRFHFYPSGRTTAERLIWSSWSSVEATDTTQWDSVMSRMFRLAGGRRSTTSCNPHQLFLHSQWSSSRCLCISRIFLWLRWTWWSVQGHENEIFGLCLRGDVFANEVKSQNRSRVKEWDIKVFNTFSHMTKSTGHPLTSGFCLWNIIPNWRANFRPFSAAMWVLDVGVKIVPSVSVQAALEHCRVDVEFERDWSETYYKK